MGYNHSLTQSFAIAIMNHQQKATPGFVLLLSLLMLAILSVIVFAALEDSQLQYKMVSAWQQHVKHYLANQSLLLITAKQLTINHAFNCITPLDSDADLRDKNSQWWRSSHVCHQQSDGIKLAFQIEAQQLLPCTELINKYNKKKSSSAVLIYRVTSVSLGRYGVTTMLQASVAAPMATQAPGYICLKKEALTAGIISWRQIS